MNTSQSKLKSRRFGLFTGITLAVALTAGFAGDVRAEEASGDKSNVRYERPSSKVKAKETLDTKFKEEQQRQEREDKKKVQMIAGTEFAKKREAVAQEIADQQIEQLKRLLNATDPTDPEYADLLFRLADHFLEKKAYFELQTGSLYEQIYTAEEKGQKDKAKQLKAKQKAFEGKSKEASEQAVKLYKALTTSPALAKYKRIDEALYFYAFELGQLGREAEMKDAYVKLIQDYPNSQYIPNAYLSFADYYFNKNQIGDALRLYEKVITFKDSPVYAYALYKMGWCHLNPVGTADPRYDLSLKYFVDTVKATRDGRAGSEANAKQLRRDARRDMVQSYAQVGKPSKAYEFFKQIGDGPKKDEDMSRKMMELLAVRYFGGGFYTESTFIYKQLQDTFPEDAQACEWQGRIVINALATDNKDVQWQETDALGKYWDKFRDGKYSKAIKRKCRDETLDTMKQMATVWHDEAEKTKNTDTYALAERAYESFLRTFPNDKERYEIQLYYAELLWARATALIEDKATKDEGLKKFRRAHEEFVKVLEIDPSGKFTQDAAYAQMLAMKNALEYDETGGQSKACKTNSEGVCVYADKKKVKKVSKSKEAKVDTAAEFPETEYTEDEKSMLNAYEIYQKYVKKKDDKELPKIMYHRAKLMMLHNKFKEAKPLTEEIVTKFDGTIYAAWCAQMLLDILTINWTKADATPEEQLKSSDDLEKWAKKFQTMKVYKHEESEELRKALPRLLAGIGWKKGMAYLEAGRNGDPDGYRLCAEQFIGIYNEYGENHDQADTLIWNAAQCYEASFLLGQAVRFRKILLEKYPESKHAKATLQYLGGNYQAIAMYERAAERYEAYADKYIKEDDAPAALQNAYLYRLGLGQIDKADENLRRYENLYKKKDPQKAATIFWSRHDILRTDDEKLKHAQDYLKTYSRTGGDDRQIVAEAVIGQILWRQSCEKGLLYDSCMTIQRKTAVAGEKARQRGADLKRRAKQADTKKKDSPGKKKVDIPKYCGSATSGLVTIYPRNKKKAATAQGHLTNVIKLASKAKISIPEEDRRRQEDFRNAVAMAQVYRADQDYEEYLTLEMPSDLNFNVEEWKKDSGLPKWEKEYKEQFKKAEDSKKRLIDWKTKKEGLGAKLVEAYDGIVAAKQSPHWMLAAAARSAMVSQNFADQLYRAEVPTQFKTEEEYYAYCDALSDMAGPIQEAAVQKFTYCLDRSTQYQFFNEFSRLCEDELQQRDPDKYPATNEIFGDSIYTDSRPDVVEVQLDLEGEKRKANLGGSKSSSTKKKADKKGDES